VNFIVHPLISIHCLSTIW